MSFTLRKCFQTISVNDSITVTGHLVRLDDRKKKIFGEISDGTTNETLKFIYFGNQPDSDDILSLRKAPPGSSLTLKGTVRQAPAKAVQQYELEVESVIIHSVVRDPETYPYGLKAHKKRTNEELIQHLTNIRSNEYTRFRDKTFQTIMRLRSNCYTHLVNFFTQQGFVKIDSPILTSSDCEGAGETFTVTTLNAGDSDYSKDFFGKKTYLSVSGQLEIEAAARALCGGVYTFGPTFRAEHSRTSRHLAEFLMLEPEMVFSDTEPEHRFNKLLKLQYDMIAFVVNQLFSNQQSADDLEYLTDYDHVTKLQSYFKNNEFPSITYTEAIDILKKDQSKVMFENNDIYWGMDLGAEHERYLSESVFQGPVFITHYPHELKSFYMKSKGNSKTCQAVDLLVPGIGELCGGSMREDDPDKLLAVMNKRGMNVETLQWYIDLRYDGGLPTGGFGLGFERFICFITNQHNVKDVIPFPRSY